MPQQSYGQLSGAPYRVTFPTTGAGSVCIAADTAYFTYDGAGRILTANNIHSRITRQFGTINGLPEGTGEWPGGKTLADGQFNLGSSDGFIGGLAPGLRDASGLKHRRARYLNPQTGQFTQSDPIGLAGGSTLYGYALGDPINIRDADGLCPVWVDEKPCGIMIDSEMTPADARDPSGMGGSFCGMTRTNGTRDRVGNIVWDRGHSGFDWKASKGTRVFAPAYAVVTAIKTALGGFGLIIDLGNGARLQVDHLDGFHNLKVGQSVAVKAGTLIGYTGDTGNAANDRRDDHAHVVAKIGSTYYQPQTFFGPAGATCEFTRR